MLISRSLKKRRKSSYEIFFEMKMKEICSFSTSNTKMLWHISPAAIFEAKTTVAQKSKSLLIMCFRSKFHTRTWVWLLLFLKVQVNVNTSLYPNRPPLVILICKNSVAHHTLIKKKI